MREHTVKIYTLVMTATDVDWGLFQSPTEYGSYLSPQRAKQKLEELIKQEQEKLRSRYDREERTETSWEAYADGEVAAHFVRVEIVTSLLHLTPQDKELPGLHVQSTSLSETGEVPGGICSCEHQKEDGGETDRTGAWERQDLAQLLYLLEAEFCCCVEKVPFVVSAPSADMEVEGWRFLYNSLDAQAARYFVTTGRCRKCGRTAVSDCRIEAGPSADDLFLSVWQTLKQEAVYLGLKERLWEKEDAQCVFTELFHVEDRPRARQWFEKNAVREVLAWG